MDASMSERSVSATRGLFVRARSSGSAPKFRLATPRALGLLCLLLVLGAADAVANKTRGSSELHERLVERSLPSESTLSEGLRARRDEVRRVASRCGHCPWQLLDLVRALEDPDPWVQALAAEGIQYFPARHRRRAVAALGTALRSNEFEVRVHAAITLSTMSEQSEPIEPVLREALASGDEVLVLWASRALWECVPPTPAETRAAIDALRRSSWRHRMRAAETLGACPEPSDAEVTALVEALSDAHPCVHSSVLAALRRLGPRARAAVPALSAALDRLGGPRRVDCAKALVAMGTEACSALPGLKRVLLEEDSGTAELVHGLTHFGSEGYRLALELIAPVADESSKDAFRRRSDLRLAVMSSLAAHAVPRAVVVDVLVAQLGSRDPALVKIATRELAKIGPDARAAMPLLRERLAAGVHRVPFAWALVAMEPSALAELTERVFLPALREGRSNDLYDLGEAIGEGLHLEVAEGLGLALRHARGVDFDVASPAISLLSLLPASRADRLGAFRIVAREAEPKLAARALHGLRRLAQEDPSLLPELMEAAGASHPPEVRHAALRALSTLGPKAHALLPYLRGIDPSGDFAMEVSEAAWELQGDLPLEQVLRR